MSKGVNTGAEVCLHLCNISAGTKIREKSELKLLYLYPWIRDNSTIV